MIDSSPTLAGFTDFVRNVMGISVGDLPDDSPWLEFSYDIAIDIVNDALNTINGAVYTQAVYNLAGDNLINFAQDGTGQTYFADLRKQWNILGFVPGVVESTSDEGTSASYVVQEAAKTFTLADIQNLKTPYGRRQDQSNSLEERRWVCTASLVRRLR
jgi:hypothetical protein